VSDDAGSEQPTAGARVYRVDATGARAVLVGDGSAQHNYFQFFAGTWTDGVAPQPLVGTSGQVESPYRGLEAFRETDADFFFGRDTAIGEVLSRLSDCLAGTGLLVVSGVSGAGKTSLLRAGVLRELRRAGLPSEPEAARWPCVVFVPGGRPLNELALAIAPVTGADAAAVRQSLDANPADFALTARQAAQFSGTDAFSGPDANDPSARPAAGQRRVLLVVDQFETVFTQCDRDEERTAFITALCAAGRAGAAVVVIVIRADLEARLADQPELADAVQGRYLLGAMTERQLRLAITAPAGTVDSAVDDDLVAELLREVRAHADRPGGGSRTVGAGVLPLLSHALDQAWRGRPPAALAGHAPLALADYERTGGIDRAVADSAQAAYATLTAAQRAVAQQVFTRLTATTADGIDTAVRATRAELLADRDASAVADVEAALTAFAKKRLLTLAADTVEISHEILLSAWPLLRDDWLAATRADRASRARLQVTVTEWLASGRDRSFLYNGSQLDAAARAADRIAADGRQTSLSREERAFLAASRRAAERAARVRRAAVAGIAVLATGLAVALIIATTSGQQAVRAEHTAVKASNKAQAELAEQTSGLLASESLTLQSTDPPAAAEDSVLAWALNSRSQQARYALQSSAADPLVAVFRAVPNPVTALEPVVVPESVAFSPDGKSLAVSGYGEDHTGAQLWNLVTDSEIGDPLAVGSTTGTSGLSLLAPEAFSPDGKSLIVADAQTVTRWDISTGREAAAVRFPTLGILTSAALSPDGKALAAGDLLCGCVQLVNAATGQQIGTPLSPVGRAALAHLTGNILVAFSPDGKTLITAGPDDAVRIWSVATYQQVGPAFPPLASPVESLAVSPDGSILATGEDDGTVRLWDIGTGRPIGQPLIAGARTGAAVETVAFSPDGSMIAAGDQNSTVRVWSVPTRDQVGPALSGGLDTVNAVAFSPDGRELASADNDGSVRLWKLTALAGSQAVRPVPGSEGIGADGDGAFALGPDEELATSDDTDQVTVWEPSAGYENGYASSPVPNPSSSTESDGPVNVALSPDGRTLATGANDGSVRLWNLPAGLTAGTPARTIPSLVPPTNSPTVQFLAFSPNGSRLAVYYADGTAEVFDTATGQPVIGTQTAANLPGNVVALGFAQGGASVLIVCSNGDVITWDPTTDHTSTLQFAPLSNVSSSLPPTVALSPDGTTIAFSTSDTVQLRDLVTGQQIGNSIDPGDGAIYNLAFSPDGKTLATGAADGTVRLWNVGYLTPVGALAELCARIRPTMTAAAWTATPAQQADRSYQQACAGGT
jgi:WD40 repeat protein